MSSTLPHGQRFGRFEIRADERQLLVGGQPAEIGARAFDLLLALFERRDRMVSKAELLDLVWAGVVVEENNLQVQVSALRKLLGPQAITTVPGRGYRFTAAVVEPGAAPPRAAQVAASSWPPRWAAPLGACLLLAVIVASGIGPFGSSNPAHIDADLPATRSVAVMPFADLDPQPTPYLAAGVTQEILTDLGHLPDAFIVSGSGEAAGPALIDARRVGRELGVRYLLTGSVRRDGERLVIDVQMVRTDSGALLWSERFEPRSDDWGLVRDVSQRVAASLEAKLQARDPASDDARNGMALALWTHGDYLMRHAGTRDELLEARRILEAALAADPRSMHALGALAQTYTLEVIRRWAADPRRTMALARDDATRALALDPDHPLALSALGNALMWSSDVDAALPLFERELKANPNSACAHFDMASLLYFMARFDQVRPEVEATLRLGPLDSARVGNAHSVLGFSLLVSGHEEEAYQELQRSVAASPTMPGARYGLIAAAALTGRIGEAHALVAEALRQRPEMTITRMRTATVPRPAAFRDAHRRYFEGLRLAGLPEGEPLTKLAEAATDQNRK